MWHWFFGPARDSKVQFFRYFFVGGSSAVVHLSIYYTLIWGLGVHYLIANVIGFCVSFFWNYIVGILWVFHNRRMSRRREIALTYVIAVLGLLWNSIILYACVEALGISPNLAIYIATAIVLFWNFGMRKKFIFA